MDAFAAISSLPQPNGLASGLAASSIPAVVVVLRSYVEELEAARAEIARLRADNATLARALDEMFQVALIP